MLDPYEELCTMNQHLKDLMQKRALDCHRLCRTSGFEYIPFFLLLD